MKTARVIFQIHSQTTVVRVSIVQSLLLSLTLVIFQHLLLHQDQEWFQGGPI